MHFMVFLNTRGATELVPTVHVAVAYLKFSIPNLNIKIPPYCSKDLSYYPQKNFQCFHISPNNIYHKERLETAWKLFLPKIM